MLTRKRPPKTTLLSGGIFQIQPKMSSSLAGPWRICFSYRMVFSWVAQFSFIMYFTKMILNPEETANLPQCLYSTPERPWQRGHFPLPAPAFVFIFNAVRRVRGRLSFPTPSSILNRNFQLLTLFFPIFKAATRRHVTRSLNYLYMYIRNLTFKRFCDVPLYRSRERYRNKVAWISKNIKTSCIFYEIL